MKNINIQLFKKIDKIIQKFKKNYLYSADNIVTCIILIPTDIIKIF